MEQFLLSQGWIGIIVLGLLWRIRELTVERNEERKQKEALIAEIRKNHTDTIQELKLRGGLNIGGHQHVA